MKMLFLDLEETVVDDIENCNPLEDNVAKIKDFIDRWQPDRIETFSWAFWTPSDMAHWRHISPWLDAVLGRKVHLQAFDVTEQRFAFLNNMLGRVFPGEEIEFARLATKEKIFEWFIRENFEDGHFVLIDDMVPAKCITLHRGRLIIEFISVKEEF